MNNISIYQKFEQSIRWNALEAGVYHSLLLLHQIALFFVISPGLYGLVGTLFSLIYLTITITNGGLDCTLPIFFPSKVSSREHFKYSVGTQLIPELVLLVIGAGTGIWYIYTSHTFPLLLSCGLGFLLITEGLRKTIRTLLQLLFFNKLLMLIELSALLFYILHVWTWIGMGVSLTVHHIFFPMLISSVLALGAKIAVLYAWYRQLPEITNDEWITTGTILRHRIFTYITQLSHTLFSSNFLVPVFAIRFGMHSAALFKIMSWCVQAVSLCFKKIFGVPGTALLAHIRTTPIALQQHVFSLITHTIFYWLCIVMALCMIVPYALIVLYPSAFSHLSYALVFIYITLTLSEHFFMSYETWLITQEKTIHLCFFTGFSLGLLAAVLHATRFSSPIVLVCGIFFARLCSFACISLAVVSLWRIHLPWPFTQKSEL